MIDLNNDKKNNNRTIPAATIFTLAIIMTALTIAAPVAITTTTATTMPQPVTVATDNQSVNVLLSWEPVGIEPGQDTEFTLEFQDPSSGEPINHVNYNFEIIDQNGGTVQSITDLHTHSGSDEQTVTFDTAGSFNVVATIIGTGINPPFDTTQSGTAQTVITVGQQLAGATDGNNTAGTTDNITATTGGGGAPTTPSACDPTQMAAGGGAGGQNATTNATTMSGGGGTNATAGNATTAGGGGGNQTTSSPTQLIEQACIAALNNDTQGVLMNLNSALNALGGNMTTTAGVVEEIEEEGDEEEEVEEGEED
ncbi:MAG: hypothetical protein M3299_04670 [Thermoproteota archaeon]|nr:hypothetical protein [Thermoproteota archaeon]